MIWTQHMVQPLYLRIRPTIILLQFDQGLVKSQIFIFIILFSEKIIFTKILFLAMTRQTTPKKERRPHTATARISSARKERVCQVYDHIMLRLLFLTPTLSEFEILNDSTSIIQKWLDFGFSSLEFRCRT